MKSIEPKPSKQIKLTSGERAQLRMAVEKSSLSKKEYIDGVVLEFISANKGKTVAFLKPSNSGNYHSVRISENVLSQLKQFAGDSDVSENAVLFTAVKKKLVDLSNKAAELDKAS